MSFSVGICAYNEEQNIGQLLNNILNHKTKHHLEKIIVVASGCTDRTNEIVNKWVQKDKRVRLIVEPKRKGKYSAVNLVLANNQSEILVMTDADCLWQDKAIDCMLPNFDKPNIGAVCGKTVPLNPKDTFWGYIADFRYRLFDHHAWENTRKGIFCHLSGYLYAMKKGIVDKMPAIIQDDYYIGHTIYWKGYKIYYEPHAIVNIMHPTSFRALIKQRRRIRLGHMELRKLTGHHISTTNPIQIIPSVLRHMNYTPLKIIYTFIVVCCEQWAVYLARRDFKKGRIKLAWDYVDGSKRLKDD